MNETDESEPVPFFPLWPLPQPGPGYLAAIQRCCAPIGGRLPPAFDLNSFRTSWLCFRCADWLGGGDSPATGVRSTDEVPEARSLRIITVPRRLASVYPIKIDRNFIMMLALRDLMLSKP